VTDLLLGTRELLGAVGDRPVQGSAILDRTVRSIGQVRQRPKLVPLGNDLLGDLQGTLRFSTTKYATSAGRAQDPCVSVEVL